MLSKKAVGRGDLDIILMIRVFLKFGNQVLFGLSGMEQCVTAQLSDEDATEGVSGIVAGMDADALKTGYVIEQG